MFPVKVVVLVIAVIRVTEGLDVMFAGCGAKGFSCVTTNNKIKVTYECTAPYYNATFAIHRWNAPSQIESLVIKNCKQLKVNFECTTDRTKIQNLTIANITNLVINPTPYADTPPFVHFYDIKSLETIPSNIFTQANPRKHRTNCIVYSRFKYLNFTMVHIGAIATNAFTDLHNLTGFFWDMVHVDLLQTGAVKVVMEKEKDFIISRSHLGHLEPLALQIFGREFVMDNNEIGSVSSYGINGTANIFNFTKNTIDSLQSNALTLLAKTVTITSNHFQQLHTGALEKITPGLRYDSRTNFAQLMFSFQFTYNLINMADPASFNPDVVSYSHVANTITTSNNSMFCSCGNSAWLLRNNLDEIEAKYYEKFLKDPTNVCGFSCQLPVSSLRMMVKNGVCQEEITIESLCNTQRTTTRITYTVYDPMKKMNDSIEDIGNITWLESGGSGSLSGHVLVGVCMVMVFVAFL